MEIRILKTEEIPQAVSMARGVFDYCLRQSMQDMQAVQSFLDYTREEQIRHMVERGQLTLWGAFEQNQMIAMSGMQREGHITMLYVLPLFQRRGCGKELLKAMRAYAKTQYGLANVTLNAMPQWTASYFAKRKFQTANMMQVNRAPYLSMRAKSIQAVEFGKKPLSTGVILGTTMAGLCASVAIAVGFMVAYMNGIV